MSLFKQNLRIAVSLFFLVAGAIDLQADSKPDQTTQNEDSTAPLPGLIPNPQPLQGNRRWQMMTKNCPYTVGNVAWSPDGRWLAISTGPDVRLFDVQTGVPEFKNVLMKHRGYVTAIRYNSQGDRIATASLDGTVRIWDLETRTKQIYRGHEGAVNDVSWHPDGKRLASAGYDRTVQIWDVDGTTLFTLKGHQASVDTVSWNPDGKLLASGCQKSTIRYWSAESEPGPIVEGELGPISSITWSPDGTKLLSCESGIVPGESGNDDVSFLRVWDRDGKEIHNLRMQDTILTNGSWSPDGTRVIVGGMYRSYVWIVGEAETKAWPGYGARVPVAWRPTGDLAAAGAILVNKDGNADLRIPIRHVELNAVSLSPEQDVFAVGRANQHFYLFDTDGNLIRESPTLNGQQRWVNSFCWHPDGSRLIPGMRYCKILQQYDFEGDPVDDPIEIPADMRAVAWSRDGRYVAAGGDNQTVALVDLISGESIQLGKQEHGITQVRFTPDQTQVCSAGFDGCVRFWFLDGKPGKVINAEMQPIRGLTWASDGKLMATGHEDGTIRFWDGDGKHLKTIPAHGNFVEALEFNPKGTLLASAGRDNTVRIWTRDGSPKTVFQGHSGTVFGICWTRDGRQLYSCGDDGTVRLWDAETGETEWQILFGDNTGFVTVDAHGQVLHGEENVLSSDFLYFEEDSEGRLEPSSWTQVRDTMVGR